VREVAGSNPVVPTNIITNINYLRAATKCGSFFVWGDLWRKFLIARGTSDVEITDAVEKWRKIEEF